MGCSQGASWMAVDGGFEIILVETERKQLRGKVVQINLLYQSFEMQYTNLLNCMN